MNRPYWCPSGVVADATVKFYQDILAYWKSRGLATGQFQRDGLLGRNTTAAVTAFQTQAVRNGVSLTVNGVLDEPTRAALLRGAPQALAAGFIRSLTPPGGTPAAQTQGDSTGSKGAQGAQDASTGSKGAQGAQDDSTGSKVVGTQPKVDSIVTKGSAAGPGETVAVPESVSKMISPEAAQQLSNMPADQVRSFVGQLEQRASTEAAAATQDVALNATPVVGSDGRVSLGIERTPAGLWDTLSGGQKAAIIGGGAIVGLGIIALVVVVASGPRSNPPKRRRRRR